MSDPRTNYHEDADADDAEYDEPTGTDALFAIAESVDALAKVIADQGEQDRRQRVELIRAIDRTSGTMPEFDDFGQ